MRIEQSRWRSGTGWEQIGATSPIDEAQLVLAFGSTAILKQGTLLQELAERYPRAHILGCSTAGEILGTEITDDSLVSTAIHFTRSQLHFCQVKISAAHESYAAGSHLAASLPRQGLVHVFVLSEGSLINGSELVRGLTEHLPDHVTVTGGLAGDGDRFAETYVIWNGTGERHAVTAIGFYGQALQVGYASLGGWDPFGPERLVTRAEGNVLYELDGKSALELYKKYLGDHAQGLPATGLLFPLSIRIHERERGVVRTILAVDEEKQCMTFAGDVPEEAYARFMKANFDRLIDGAAGAARICHEATGQHPPELAILISCVGRKMVLRQRVEEEVENVREVLGVETALTGFYSYGEISPFSPQATCELHNQTMTITTLSEGAP